MSTLYLAWRQPSQRWWPVGRLSYDGSEYVFAYTKGARSAADAGFRPLSSFPDLDEVYFSRELFPMFANRLPPPSRPDYEDFVEWLDLGSAEQDPMGMLARSGGQRETDMFEVFPAPVPAPGTRYESAFFVHGLRFRGPDAEAAVRRLAPGDPLVLQADPENPHDPRALRVLSTLNGVHLGFVPRYLCEDIHTLQQAAGTEDLTVRVRRINVPPAPAQFRVLCEMSAPWPAGFQALAHPDFEPIRALVPAGRK
jgi:HIRAN domain-containing protein